VLPLFLSGNEATFRTFRETVQAFGAPAYLGFDVGAACVVSDTSTAIYECIVAAFFEAAAYAAIEGAELESLLAVVPSAIRLAEATIEYSARQMAAGDFAGDQASIDVHVNGIGTLVRAMAGRGDRAPKLARVVLDYLEEAQRKQLGSLEIAAVYGMLLESLGGS
jgi:3-hydroxyisobutyrate dehydrogenase